MKFDSNLESICHKPTGKLPDFILRQLADVSNYMLLRFHML